MSQQLATRPLAGLPITVATLEQATQWLCEQALDPETQGLDIHLANAYTIALTDRDPGYKTLLAESSAIFPDGKPLEWVTRPTKHPLSQVRGPSLFEATMDRGRDMKVRHFLLGGSDETLEKLVASLEKRYSGVDIVGAFSPPFRPMSAEELATQDEMIQQSGAHIVWVGLGTPKQDHEAQRVARESGKTAVAVGAAFDFSAGTKPTAPPWMSRIGLEWLFRLLTEPRRLWKRYLLGNLAFVGAVLNGLMSGRRQP